MDWSQRPYSHLVSFLALATAWALGACDSKPPRDAAPEPDQPDPTITTGVTEDPGAETEERRWPNSPADVLRKGAAHRDEMPAAHIGDVEPVEPGTQEPGTLALAPPSGSRWQFIGPKAITFAGRVNGVAFSKSNGPTRWAATATGGAWKTTNGGGTWTPMSDAWSMLETTSVAIHPTNANIVYVGTGDFDGGFARYGLGIMRTTDGGNTWSQSNPDMGDTAVSAIVVDPDNPSIVTATSGRGVNGYGFVWHSTDGGSNWYPLDSAGSGIWSDLKVGAKDQFVTGLRPYYAARWDSGSIYRSTDHGETWNALPVPWSYPMSPIEIAPSPLNPGTVYAMLYPVGASGPEFYISNDWGETWDGLPGGAGFLGWGGSQGGYNLALACGGTSYDQLYAGLQNFKWDIGVWQATHGTWHEISGGHADHHFVAVDPSNRYNVLIGNDGGVYAQTYNPSTDDWAASATNQNATLSVQQFYSVGTHPGNAAAIIGGTQDIGTIDAFGDLSAWKTPMMSDGGFSAFNPGTPTIIYSASNGPQLRRTDDYWATYELISPPWDHEKTSFLGAYGIDRKTPKFLYAAGTYLYRYDATAKTWSGPLGNTAIATSNGAAAAVAVAKSDSNVVYTGANDGTIWMIQNASNPSPANFKRLSDSLPYFETRPVNDVSVNPSNKNDIVIAGDRAGVIGGGGLWRCRNTLANPPVWEFAAGSGLNRLPDVGMMAIARDPEDPTNLWYVGTEVGMFYTANAGTTWTNATAPLGLPNVPVRTVEVNDVTRYLTVGTFGRGVWRIRIGGGSLSDLVVTGSSMNPVSPRNGNNVTFSATIKNQGAGATPNNVVHSVSFSVDGTVRSGSTASTATLAPGASRTITATSTWKATTGSHTLLVRVDENNRISESNETNNSRTNTFNVAP